MLAMKKVVEFEDRSMGTSQTEMQIEKRMRKCKAKSTNKHPRILTV
jgi:hypothetical protein